MFNIPVHHRVVLGNSFGMPQHVVLGLPTFGNTPQVILPRSPPVQMVIPVPNIVHPTYHRSIPVSHHVPNNNIMPQPRQAPAYPTNGTLCQCNHTSCLNICNKLQRMGHNPSSKIKVVVVARNNYSNRSTVTPCILVGKNRQNEYTIPVTTFKGCFLDAIMFGLRKFGIYLDNHSFRIRFAGDGHYHIRLIDGNTVCFVGNVDGFRRSELNNQLGGYILQVDWLRLKGRKQLDGRSIVLNKITHQAITAYKHGHPHNID